MSAENEIFLYGKVKHIPKLKVYGFIPSVQYQKCKYLAQRLHSSYPREYGEPVIKGMLNVEWDEYLTKMRRKFGERYYATNGLVLAYLDDELIGDDNHLVQFVKTKYDLEINLNFERIAEEDIVRYFTEIIETYKRKFVYLTIAIGERVIGSLLFMLYNDLVPQTCENFLNRCISTVPNYTYRGTRVHRIARYSWVQCGGFDLMETPMPCENYVIPHDRRGVLSMCNRKRHTENSTQFYITLNPACWMDYHYVAFGFSQLIQGAEILNVIEKVPTYFESPTRKITILYCGEFSLCPVPNEEYTKALNPPYEELFEEVKDDDIDSLFSETGFKTGKYFLKSDLRHYLPFLRYSQMFDAYLKKLYEPEEEIEHEEAVEEEEEAVKPHEERSSLFKSSPNFYLKLDNRW